MGGIIRPQRRGLLIGGAALVAFSALLARKARAFPFPVGAAGGGSQISNGVYNVKTDYGAKGDTILLADGAMSSSINPTHLSSASASFASGDIGKSVCVSGAGAAGVPLITTIASISSGTVAVLTTGASTTVSSAIVHYGTDDTVAIQNAINAVFVSVTGAGVVYSPPGIYMIAGALKLTSTLNSQLTMPQVTGTSQQVSITFAGATRPEACVPGGTVLSNDPPPIAGSIWFSPIAGSGSWPSLLAAGTMNTGSFGSNAFNLVNVTIGNMIFRSAWGQSPPIALVQMGSASTLHIEDCAFDTDATSNSMAAAAPVTGATGLVMPSVNNAGYNRLMNTTVFGQDNGVWWTEHGDLDEVYGVFCNETFVVQQAYHTMRAGRIGMYSCKNLITAGSASGPGKIPLAIQQAAIEHNTSGSHWFASTTDVVDSGNAIYGTMIYNVIVSGLGYDNGAFSQVGASNFKLNALF